MPRSSAPRTPASSMPEFAARPRRNTRLPTLRSSRCRNSAEGAMAPTIHPREAASGSDPRGEQRGAVAQWELDREASAATGALGDGDAAAVVRDDAVHDREAEAGAALGVLRREVGREHLVLEVGRDPGPVVLDHEDRAIAGLAERG